VSGLGDGALVRLNGIEIGRVARIELDPKDPMLVTLILQVRKAIEIHADAVASLETQGLTGVSYVEISGGTLGSPPLRAATGERYPTLASRPSSLQRVFDNAPELLARLLVIADRLEAVLDKQNRSAIAQTLINIHDTTAVFDRRSKDIDQLIVDGGQTMHNLADASATLKILLANLDRTSAEADRLVVVANGTFDHATKLATDLDAVVHVSGPGLHYLVTVPIRLTAKAARKESGCHDNSSYCIGARGWRNSSSLCVMLWYASLSRGIHIHPNPGCNKWSRDCSGKVSSVACQRIAGIEEIKVSGFKSTGSCAGSIDARCQASVRITSSNSVADIFSGSDIIGSSKRNSVRSSDIPNVMLNMIRSLVGVATPG
jgi:hypothetical protein